jgi:hypothetical protein
MLIGASLDQPYGDEHPIAIATHGALYDGIHA